MSRRVLSSRKSRLTWNVLALYERTSLYNLAAVAGGGAIVSSCVWPAASAFGAATISINSNIQTKPNQTKHLQLVPRDSRRLNTTRTPASSIGGDGANAGPANLERTTHGSVRNVTRVPSWHSTGRPPIFKRGEADERREGES